jgi:hypothetical protein
MQPCNLWPHVRIEPKLRADHGKRLFLRKIVILFFTHQFFNEMQQAEGNALD